MIPSSAYMRFSPDGAAAVDASLHLTGNSFIHCCTHSADLDTTRRLADAVAAYITDLERQMAAHGTAAGEGVAA